MLVLVVLLLALFAASAQVTSPIPLSAASNGFTRGSASSSVTVNFWIDLGCSDCLSSWPLLNDVYEAYKGDVKFVYHLMPLPYHQFAFMLAKSA